MSAYEPHHLHIRACYALASAAVARGDHPFGALLVLDGAVVGSAMNAVDTRDDPTRHAETELLRDVLPTIARESRSRVVLYTSTEPCAMCTSAIYWSGITAIVFGCSSESLAAEAGADFLMPSHELLSRGNRKVDVIGPVLDEEGRAQHRAYWSARRET